MSFRFLDNLLGKSVLPGMCSIYLLPDKLVVCHALHEQRLIPTITFVEMSICQPTTLRLMLSSILKKHGLKNMKCVWILHPDYYQIFVLDRPNLSDNEMAAALRWQVKNLISYPAEDAVIEYFTQPSKYRTKEKIFAVTAKKSQLQAVADVIAEVGFDLQNITITELALGNLMVTKEDLDCYSGLLVIGLESAELVIVFQNKLLLSVRIVLPEASSPEYISHIVNNVLQAFQFCQNQQQEEHPRVLQVIGDEMHLSELANAMSEVKVSAFQIEKKCELEVLSSQGQWPSEVLITIGGALSQEASNAAN